MDRVENPNIKVEIKHSKTKKAWNIVGTNLGRKYKIAIVPYLEVGDNILLNELQKSEALRHAEFISFCFNNAGKIKWTK